MSWNNAFYLVIPILVIRYLYVSWTSKSKLAELDFFPPAVGFEKLGKAVYILINTFLLFSPLFLEICHELVTLLMGLIIYVFGLILYLKSVHDFISETGLIMNGIYRYTRNPQSVSFIVMYLGIAVATCSFLYLLLTLILVWAFNQLAKSEERYCLNQYGESYLIYLKLTHRFILFIVIFL